MKIADKISTILCDDARQETGGKHSLMGVYSGDMVFRQLPAILPQLTLCIVLENVRTLFRKCEVTLILPKIEPSVIPLEIGKQKLIGRKVYLFAAIAPFKALATGDAEFQVRFDNNKRPSTIHKFKILEATKS